MTALKYTLKQVRERQLAHVGTIGRPNAWWPTNYETDADCMAFQAWSMGLRSRTDMRLPVINIDQFLLQTTWDRVDVADLRPGDLIFQNWTKTSAGRYGQHPEHVGMLYSPIVDGKVTTIEANTGPEPGVRDPNGCYKKTRNLEDPAGQWLLFGYRPLFAHPASTATPASIKKFRIIGTWLNKPENLPAGCLPSACGDIDRKHGDGIPGPRLWTNVQWWGSEHNKAGQEVDRPASLYPVGFWRDGIEGTRSEYIADIIYALATKR